MRLVINHNVLDSATGAFLLGLVVVHPVVTFTISKMKEGRKEDERKLIYLLVLILLFCLRVAVLYSVFGSL